MTLEHIPPHIRSWITTAANKQYDRVIPQETVRNIRNEKLVTVYGWALAEYFITRTAIASAAVNVLAGLTNVPSHYEPQQFVYPILGALAISAVGAVSVLRDGTINGSLMSIDRKIKMSEFERHKSPVQIEIPLYD